MMDSLLTQIDQGVATLTLNRPKTLNALDAAMAWGLREATARCESDDAVRCVVIRGAGGHFMAGGDIGYFQQCLELENKQRQAAVGAVISAVHASIQNLRRMGKPVVAGVRGACAGFGVSLMAACDLALAAEDTVFSLAYCRIGVSPDGGSTYFLPRMLGMKRAMELALLGERFDSRRALYLGLINRIAPTAELEGETAELAARLAAGPRLAYAQTKRLLNHSMQADLDLQLRKEQESFIAGVATADFEEGVRAFCEKRKPRFRGV